MNYRIKYTRKDYENCTTIVKAFMHKHKVKRKEMGLMFELTNPSMKTRFETNNWRLSECYLIHEHLKPILDNE